MKLMESVSRAFILKTDTAVQWLRTELQAARVRIPLTDSCLLELVREADAATLRDVSEARQPYVNRLRQQLVAQADFIRCWTGSDERLVGEDEQSVQAAVRIARKYALPRRWKLSEPTVVEYRRTRPSYWHWTDEMDSDAVA
ncbi:MAG TPA: hypothetical protein VIY54_05395 [Steroidobacteraceae bacterium]